MEIKHNTEVSVKTRRRFIIRTVKSAEQFLCPECGGSMLAAEMAAELLGVSRRDIYRTIEAGAAHFAETEAGAVLICLSRAGDPNSPNGRPANLEKYDEF